MRSALASLTVRLTRCTATCQDVMQRPRRGCCAWARGKWTPHGRGTTLLRQHSPLLLPASARTALGKLLLNHLVSHATPAPRTDTVGPRSTSPHCILLHTVGPFTHQ